ncbi:zinc finger protein CONSTANS-LIKE 5 [Tanacetum coccineum]
MVENTGGADTKCFSSGWTAIAKLCDSCKSTSAILFCRTDKLFLCIACDLKIHGQTKHERVWMCEVCEQAAASVTCKADAAALCVTCDRDIHSVNLLASRHERVPVVSFYDSAEDVVSFANLTAQNLTQPIVSDVTCDVTTSIHVQYPLDVPQVMVKSADLCSDRLFDFGFAIPSHVLFEPEFRDRDVPIQTTTGSVMAIPPLGPPIQTVSSSSNIDAGTASEQSSIVDVSYPLVLPVINNEKKFSAADREARVLRYKEKRKNRKYDKKIRYASRKAYAETRPRIKGRFVKQTESTTELDVDPWLLTAECGGEVEYGVVPSSKTRALWKLSCLLEAARQSLKRIRLCLRVQSCLHAPSTGCGSDGCAIRTSRLAAPYLLRRLAALYLPRRLAAPYLLRRHYSLVIASRPEVAFALAPRHEHCGMNKKHKVLFTDIELSDPISAKFTFVDEIACIHAQGSGCDQTVVAFRTSYGRRDAPLPHGRTRLAPLPPEETLLLSYCL